MSAEKLESTDKQSEKSETNRSLDEQKTQLAELYLNTLDSKREDVLGTASSLIGASLNPFRDKAIKYLLNKKGSLISQIGDNFKYAAIKAATNKANLNLEYDRTQLDTMKKILKNIQTTDQLSSLKKQIEEGKDIATITLDENSSTSPSLSKDVSKSSKSSGAVEAAALAGTVVLSEELKNVRESIEITGSFANIEKVKNADGKVFLECTAETPFINEKALDDLIGFADAFFKKTGQPLSINSAYRDIAHQTKLKKENKVPTAQPGKSGHNLGLSIDINENDRYEKDLGGIQGFRDMAKQYHFNPISSEDWHFDHESLPQSNDRLELAQAMDKEFREERLAA